MKFLTSKKEFLVFSVSSISSNLIVAGINSLTEKIAPIDRNIFKNHIPDPSFLIYFPVNTPKDYKENIRELKKEIKEVSSIVHKISMPEKIFTLKEEKSKRRGKKGKAKTKSQDDSFSLKFNVWFPPTNENWVSSWTKYLKNAHDTNWLEIKMWTQNNPGIGNKSFCWYSIKETKHSTVTYTDGFFKNTLKTIKKGHEQTCSTKKSVGIKIVSDLETST